MREGKLRSGVNWQKVLRQKGVKQELGVVRDEKVDQIS
jgi:hypothetical protein